MSNREILKHALLIRVLITNRQKNIRITKKQKEYDEQGNILFQKSTNCHVVKLEEAKQFLDILGYTELMQIQEQETTYEKDGLEIELKNIMNGPLLLEVETSNTVPAIDSIEKVRSIFDSYDLPVDKSNYFINKAELQLEELKKKST